MTDLNLRYKPPGAVAEAFRLSDAPLRLIMGPFGSGKTSACLFEFIERGRRQAPSPIDGVRRVKFGVVRRTYRELRTTTIPSWHDWMPKGIGRWSGDEPASHEITLDLGDGHPVNLIIEFIALGENKIEDVMRGWEGTGIYLNEADKLTKDVLDFASGRVLGGRYPPMRHGGPTWCGVWCDMNAPDTENWTYKFFVEAPPDGVAFFRQPSGLSPRAENLANLRAGYYQNLAVGKPAWWIRRFIENEWGYSREGKPVFTEWNDALHVAPGPIEPVPGIKLKIGLDAGLTPAGVFKQRMPDGQWRTLDEIVTDPAGSLGPTAFSGHLNRRLKERFAMFRPEDIEVYADPSAFYGGHGEDKSWVDTVRAKTGLRITPAQTNNLVPRLDAIRAPLTRLIDGHAPGYYLDPRCVTLRRAFNSGYRFRRLQIVGENERFHEEPDKNDYSHVMDADQYVTMGGGEYHEVMGRKSAAQSASGEQAYAVMEPGEEGPARRGRRRGQAFAEME